MFNKTITVDFSNSFSMPEIKLVQGEADARAIHLKLVDGGTAVNLTGCTARVYILPFGETTPLYEDLTITAVATGKCDYIVSGNAAATAGEGKLWIEIIETGAPDPISVGYSKECKLTVAVKHDFTGAIEASTAFSTLQTALAAVANILHVIGDEVVNGIKTFTSSPIFPTPAEGDNTTKASTTAFVTRAIATLLSGLVSEGTFTPILQFGGANVGITYSAQTGNYIKIWKFVLCDFTITLTNKGSSVGSAVITGLPYVCALASTVALGEVLNVTNPTAGINAFAVISGQTLVLRANRSAAAQIDYTNVEFTNTSKLRLSFCYRAST